MTGGPAVAPRAEAGELTQREGLQPDAIPRPTYFPAAMAFGLTLFFWGLVSSSVVLGTGIVLIVVSLIGWIGELRHGE